MDTASTTSATNPSSPAIDFEKAFHGVFDDPEALPKLAVLAAVSLVPILGVPLAVNGYEVVLIRQTADHADQPLPGWQRFGDILRAGIPLSVVQLVYALPLLIACAVPFFLLV